MRAVKLSALTLSVVAVLMLTNPAQAAWTLYGPMPYLSFADSPFTGAGLDYFYLEDFEDGLLNTPGVTASAGFSTKPTWPASVTDSVDGDDGVIDGFGNNGNSWFAADGATGVTFTFNPVVLGGFPTQVGIVWTDGTNPVMFQVYDGSNNFLASVTAYSIADGVYTGTTAEDRFFGMEYSGGIGKIILSNGSSGIEMDHLQYGGVIPAPGAVILAGIGAAVVGLLRRRHML